MAQEPPQSYVNCDMYFGVVPVGTTVVQTHPFKNKHFDAVTFYVNRNMRTNPIYYVFDVNKYEARVEGGGEFILKISYTPNIPGSNDFDYFNINDSRQNFYRLSFRGECIGPSISSSVRNITFFRTPNRKMSKQTFMITNKSTVPTTFQFDCSEEDPEVFTVEPIKGTLEGEQHIYITVKFLPQKPIFFYSRQLCCLFLHNDPILINLFGIWSLDKDYDSDDVAFRYFPFPHEETVGFRGYLSDSVTLKLVPPPISLTINYLDFGRMVPESSCQTLTTSITNHLNNEVKVEFENVKLFRICPKKLEIPPKQSALYECRFHPDAESRLSAAILNGHVSWSLYDHEFIYPVNVPIPINIRLIGHSFPANHLWIPSISIIPNNVILPLSLPGLPSWTTFMIKTFGHLPVLYKLLPPNKTNFIMKPMVGLIRNFQIIAVQLESSSTETTSYIEKWSIELNGQVERSTIIYVKAQTDVPRVQVGVNNIIRFEPMQPGTQSSVFIPIRNISFCHLQYEFESKDQFGVDPTKGLLAPNEEIFVTCWYNSDLKQSGDDEFEVNCRLQCISKENAVIGEYFDTTVTVLTDVTYSELCAIPHSYECEEVEYGQFIKTCFYIFNFGKSNVNFILSHNHNLKDVDLRPTIAKCGAREKLMVSIKFTIKTLGKNTLFISYHNRFNQFSNDIVTDGGGKIIFRIEYECIFPTLQIVDLLEHNFGHLFSNSDLWELFSIDLINKALKETNQSEITRVDLCVPDCEVSDKLFYLVFVIKNISNIYTRLVLKRRQVCHCKQKESNESFTFRIKVYDCPHKDMLTMEVLNPSMPANSSQSLTMNIKYLLPYQNMLSYIMELPNDRTITLNIYFNGIPADSYVLSVFDLSFTLNMGYVYIGLQEAPVFAYWLYNNTNSSVPFKVDDLEIVKLCNEDGFTVLKCLNCMGFLKPQTSAPLLFRFWPIEVKRYMVSVPLLLGMKQVQLQIQGYGSDQTNKYNFDHVISSFPNPLKNKMIVLSIDRLIIEPFLVSGITERMFFIKNTSKNQEVKYLWKPCFVDGLLKIEPLNRSGILKPRESHTVIIKVTSLNEPCSIRVLLCCEFIDCQRLYDYEQAEALYLRRQRSSMKEFSLTEGETKFEEYEMPRPPIYLNISLPITVNVVGTLDQDTCIPIENQMKQKPFPGIHLDVNTFIKEYFHHTKTCEERPLHPVTEKPQEQENTTEELVIDKNMTHAVLGQIVGDAIFSDYFSKTLRNLKTEPSPFYSQIKFDSRRREDQQIKETRRFLTQSDLSEISDICQDVIIDSLHATFRLGPKRDNQKSE